MMLEEKLIRRVSMTRVEESQMRIVMRRVYSTLREGCFELDASCYNPVAGFLGPVGLTERRPGRQNKGTRYAVLSCVFCGHVSAVHGLYKRHAATSKMSRHARVEFRGSREMPYRERCINWDSNELLARSA